MKINEFNNQLSLIQYINSYKKNFDKIFLLTQQSVVDHHKFIKNLNVHIFICEEGENCKSIEQYKTIINFLSIEECNKNSIIIGIGGGTVTDLCGFVADSYMRGIKHMLIPSTLLCMVDASVGGKTALNFNKVRNLIGSFKEPKEVIIYLPFLKTLNQDEIINGYAEIIKYSLILDYQLFQYLEKNISKLINKPFNDDIHNIIQKCIKHKLRIVKKDKFDNNIRMILNFGHTVGHALESYYDFNLSHGKAVIYGMKISSYLSYKNNQIDKNDYTRISKLIEQLNLPKLKDINSKKFNNLMNNDKKNIDNKLNYIMLNKIGEASIIENFNKKEILDALEII